MFMTPVYPARVRRLVVVAILALATVLGAVPAFAADGPGTKAVRSANETIEAALKTKAAAGSADEKKAAAKVTESVRGFLDIDELGKLALGDHWAKLSEAQRQEFLQLLRALIEDNYVKGLRANLDYQVTYLGEEAGPKTAGRDTTLVKTEIKAKKKGRPLTISVDYLLVSDKGKLRAVDIITDGVGLVQNYRAQFNRIIQKEGFDGLLTKMKKKRATA
jgi:phospholipid transport system substrate-binding protein